MVPTSNLYNLSVLEVCRAPVYENQRNVMSLAKSMIVNIAVELRSHLLLEAGYIRGIPMKQCALFSKQCNMCCSNTDCYNLVIPC